MLCFQEWNARCCIQLNKIIKQKKFLTEAIRNYKFNWAEQIAYVDSVFSWILYFQNEFRNRRRLFKFQKTLNFRKIKPKKFLDCLYGEIVLY